MLATSRGPREGARGPHRLDLDLDLDLDPDPDPDPNSDSDSDALTFVSMRDWLDEPTTG